MVGNLQTGFRSSWEGTSLEASVEPISSGSVGPCVQLCVQVTSGVVDIT